MTSRTSTSSTASEPAQTWRVPAEDAGTRLDVWLAARLAAEGGPSRSAVHRAVDQGRALINGTPAAKAGMRLAAGDEVAWLPGPAELQGSAQGAGGGPAGEDIPLPFLHRDEHIAVVDKPAGLVVHPAPGHATGTLVNALVYHLTDVGSGTPDADGEHRGLAAARDPRSPDATVRPGLVHRLDRDTSGVLVVARTDAALAALQAQFQARTTRRRYLAVVLGPRLDDEGTIRTLYGRHPRDRKRMSGRVSRGREAITHWRVLARGEALALLLVWLETGRTHQIRAHLSEAGHPVVGDPVYGRPVPKGGGRAGPELAAARRMTRQALHATSLAFDHPATGQRVRFATPPPEDMRALIEAAFGPEALGEAMAAAQAP